MARKKIRAYKIGRSGRCGNLILNASWNKRCIRKGLSEQLERVWQDVRNGAAMG